MDKIFCIAGIGSRESPKNICDEMMRIGAWCLKEEVVVRSGHATGADEAFEQAAPKNNV